MVNRACFDCGNEYTAECTQDNLCDSCHMLRLTKEFMDVRTWLGNLIIEYRGVRKGLRFAQSKEGCNVKLELQSFHSYGGRGIDFVVGVVINGQQLLTGNDIRTKIHLSKSGTWHLYSKEIHAHIANEMLAILNWAQTGNLPVVVIKSFGLCNKCRKFEVGDFDNKMIHHWKGFICFDCKEAAIQAERDRVAAENKQIREFERRAKNPRAGIVYTIQGINTTWYKIGKTNNFNNRFNRFEVKIPIDMKPIHLIYTNNMTRLENELHQRFKKKRMRGEWFDLSQEDIEYIKSINELDFPNTTTITYVNQLPLFETSNVTT